MGHLEGDELDLAQEDGRELVANYDEVESLMQDHYADFSSRSWRTARELSENFKPVPWFVWRLGNYIFGGGLGQRQLPEGLVLGFKRVLQIAARDQILGQGSNPKSFRECLGILAPEVSAAVIIIHSICRRLNSFKESQLWRPILDDALLRSQIGYFVGEKCSRFTCGRGMLSGFAARIGLAVLLAMGSRTQGSETIEKLAMGQDIGDICQKIYHTNPLQVSAMLLSACGCGSDCALGTGFYACNKPLLQQLTSDQALWYHHFKVCELCRIGKAEEITEESWLTINYISQSERASLIDTARQLVRNGLNWSWFQ